MSTPAQRAKTLLLELRKQGSDVIHFVRQYHIEDEDPAWAHSPVLYREAAQRLIRGGQLSKGLALAQEGMVRHSHEPWLCYFAAQAL